MKKKRNPLWFMASIFIIVVALLLVVNVIDKKQTESIVSQFPTFDEVTQPKDVSKLAAGDFNLANQPMLGKEDAPITIVEFGDYKCPACKMWGENILPQIQKEYIDTGKVKFHFVNFPFLALDSIYAGMASETVKDLNKDSFWKFHEEVYKSQGNEATFWANKDFFEKLVKEKFPEINFTEFQKMMENKTHLADVKQDYDIAVKEGVNSTPSIFVNGVKVPNDYNSLKAVIESELQKGAK